MLVSSPKTFGTCRWRLRRLVVACSAAISGLLGTPALALELIPTGSGDLAFYPQSLRYYPQALDLQAKQETRQPSEPYKFTANFNAGDVAQESNGALRNFSVLRKNWEQDQVEDLKLNFSTNEDWLQVSVRESQSYYAADPAYLRMLASKNTNKNSPGKEPFLLRQGAEGSAGLQRIDVKIIDSSFVGVSAFTFHNDVDPYYESLASLKSKDEFAISNRSSEAGGVKVRLGALSLTTTYTNSIMLSAPAPATMSGAGSPTETQQDQMLAIDLTDVRKRSGDAPPSVIWALAPSSIYVKLYGKQTSYATAAEGPPDRTTGVTSGAYWGWNGGNASVSYWRYYLDSQRTGDASYDSAGRGIDANFGAYAGAIGFYAGLSYRRSDDLAPISKAVDQSYDAYASAIYKPEHFPDILVEGSFGNSGYNSLVYGVTSDSAYRSGTLGLDFSKYLWTGAVPNAKVAVKGAAGGVPNLRLFYRYQVETDHGIVGATPGDSHFVGMTFRAGLSGAPDSFVGRSRPFP